MNKAYQEYLKMQEIKTTFLLNDFSENDFKPGGIVSKCGDYIDLWFYDDDGEPILDSQEDELMSTLISLGFEQHDHMLVYPFKKINMGQSELIIDLNTSELSLQKHMEEK